jgi:hypothetical protein
MVDDLVQELWLRLDTIQEKHDPQRGSLETFLSVYGTGLLGDMLNQHDRDLYVDEIYENAETMATDEVEDSHITEIDRHSALAKIKEKLIQHTGQAKISVVEHYTDVLEKRRSQRYTGMYDTPDHERLVELIKASGVTKNRFAAAIGISPQRLNAYTSRKVKVVPPEILEAAEKVVVKNAPTPMSEQEMVAWYQELVAVCELDEGLSAKAQDEYIAGVTGVSTVTAKRWRQAKVRLMPDKAKMILEKLHAWKDSVRALDAEI